MYDLYQILPGDTIETIAEKYKVSPSILMDMNKNATFAVGSKIIVPTTTEYFDIYTIEKGDSLYEIAKKYDTTADLIKEYNGLASNDLSIGQKFIRLYISKYQNISTKKRCEILFHKKQ
mgnify:CR=1 FL=1